MKRVMAVWLPNWPIQRLVIKEPELRGRAIALCAPTQWGERVTARSAAARERGVEAGMSLAEALALGRLGGGDELLTRPADPHADRRALEKLAQWHCRFSPAVGLDGGDAPDLLLLDLTGLAPLFGGEAALAQQAAAGVRRLGLVARVAVADTVGAAWAAARYGEMTPVVRGSHPVVRGSPTPHLTATEGLKTMETCGQHRCGVGRPAHNRGSSAHNSEPLLIPPGETLAALAPLPLAALRLEEETRDTLALLGVRCVGDLLALPREQLPSRFGDELLRRVDQALGAVPETFDTIPPPTEIVAEQLFERPLDDREAIDHVAGRLTERVAWLLERRGEGALLVRVTIACEEAPAQQFDVGLFQPTASARHLQELIKMRLETVRLAAPAVGVEVRAARHGPLARRQGVLFDREPSLDGSSQLVAMVDRMTARLGRESVVRCRLVGEAQPELAARREPLTGGDGKQKRKLPPQHARHAPLDRPLRLLEKPAAIETVSVAPDGPPARFTFRGERHEVARHWGPERIETGWHRRRGVRRDYYRVATTEGRRFWVFRELGGGGWFLHGSFD